MVIPIVEIRDSLVSTLASFYGNSGNNSKPSAFFGNKSNVLQNFDFLKADEPNSLSYTLWFLLFSWVGDTGIRPS